MKITIEKIRYGYIVEETDEDNQIEKTVFETSEKDMDGKHVLKRLFWYLMDRFGVYNNKHNKTKLIIKVVENRENG